jgi:hypothetical protein
MPECYVCARRVPLKQRESGHALCETCCRVADLDAKYWLSIEEERVVRDANRRGRR